MNALRLEIKQKSACFRMPTTSGIWLSYPLPPYSTIFGFLRAICQQAEETKKSINYKNTKLSISGNYRSTFFDLQTMHREDITSKQGVTEPYKIQQLYDIDLVIYIVSDEARLSIIEKGLRHPPFSLSLGRKEDLITNLKYYRIEVTKSNADELNTVKKFMPSYIPKSIVSQYDLRDDKGTLNGVFYQISLDSYFLREYNLRRMIYQKTIYITDDPKLYIGDEIVYADKQNGSLVWIEN